MNNLTKIKIDFSDDILSPILNFVNETKDGKYTKINPDISSFKYSRMQIHEPNVLELVTEENKDEVLLYGISY